MRLGIDLDGVVYDFTRDFETWARTYEKYKEKPALRFSSWEFYEEWDMSLEEFIEIQQAGVDRKRIFRYGGSYFKAITTLERLKADGHEIHIITHRHGTTAQISTLEWLAENHVPYDKLTFAEDKTTSQVDLLLDDRVKNVRASLEAGIPAIMMRQSWNRDFDTELPWIESWDEFYDLCTHESQMKALMQIIGEKLNGNGSPPDETVLQEADRLVSHDRQADYGHPRDDFAKTAKMWSAILGHPVEAHHVPLMMIAVKISRELNAPKRDNKVDIAGYAKTLEMLYE